MWLDYSQNMAQKLFRKFSKSINELFKSKPRLPT